MSKTLTEQLWDDTEELRLKIYDTKVINGIRDGSLN